MYYTKAQLLELMTTESARFVDAFKARVQQLADIVTDDTCDRGGYSPFMLGGVGPGRLWIGNRVYTRLRSYGVKFTCDKYEKTIDIPADEYSDNPAVTGAKIGQKLAESAALTDYYEILRVLKDNKPGFDTAPLFGTHEYVEQAADGSVVLDTNGDPVVLGSYSNDIPGSADSFVYLLNKQSVLRVTQEGEDFTVSIKGGSPETSEHTFDTDAIAHGWRARKIYRPGLPFNSLRSREVLTAESYQDMLDTMASFINDAGEEVDNAPTVMLVKRGSAQAAAARALFTPQTLANGASNIYYNHIKVIEVSRL